MGLRDFFSGRRKDESAIPGSMSSGEIGSTGPGDHHLDLSDPAGMAGLGQMIQAAQQQGNVTVSSGPMQTIDASGSEELRGAILKTLQEHGVDAHHGQQIQVTDPKLMAAIFKTISEHQGELGQMQAQALQQFSQMAEGGQMAALGGGTTSPMPAPQTGATADVSALEKLDALRQSGALTEDEFQAEKKKLLGC